MLVVCIGNGSSVSAQSVIMADPDFFGLQAAKGINTKEYDVMILEASARTGTLTDTDKSTSVALGHGASWIHVLNHPVTAQKAVAGAKVGEEIIAV